MVSRRSFLTLAGGLIAENQGFARIRSDPEGVLEADLTAAPSWTAFGGREARLYTYNGVYAPVLEAQAGDTLRIRLFNGLATPTNLHFHGLHVAPDGHADNPFLHAPPGESIQYELTIPKGHPSGTFWIHPHVHSFTADQVFRGLFAILLVRGELDEIPEVAAASEQLLVLKDFTVQSNGEIPTPGMMDRMLGREGSSLTVNGQIEPRLTVRQAGATRLRIVNASASRYFRLVVEEHPLYLIASEGGPLSHGSCVEEFLLAPGQRAEAIVLGSRTPGSYRILAYPYSRSSSAEAEGGRGLRTLAYLDYEGRELIPIPAPEYLVSTQPLKQPSSAVRRFVLGGNVRFGVHPDFSINGRRYDPDRVDTVVHRGAVEDWELVNISSMDHPFHVHTNSFQVLRPDLSVDPAWRDVVHVPRNGRARIRTRFADFTGRTVYHCDILDYEDLGMMGTLEIKETSTERLWREAVCEVGIGQNYSRSRA